MVLIGKIGPAHGLKGRAFIFLKAKDSSALEVGMLLQVETNQGLKNFEIEYISRKEKKTIVGFKGIYRREEIETLRGLSVFVPESTFESAPGSPLFLREVLNFKVLDHQNQLLGIVTGFSSNGPQDLIEVAIGSKKSLIPFVRDFIIKVNFDKKELFMKIPEGILDI